MSEAELYELNALYISNCILAFTVYVTLTFGYLSVAYLVAAKLTVFQSTAATCIYLFAAASCILTLMANLAFVGALGSKLAAVSEIHGDIFFSNTADSWFYAMATIMTLGVFASVYFFYNIRRRGRD